MATERPTHDMVTIPLSTFKALHTDARRYHWLRQFARSVPLRMDGASHWYIGAEAVRYRASTLDAAIDKHVAEGDLALDIDRKGAS